MSFDRTSAVRIGIIGGMIFVLHALIPYSRSWPMIWPVVTGAVAYWMATSDAAPHHVRRGMLATLVAALVVTVIAFIGSTVTVMVLSRPVLDPVARARGLTASTVTGAAVLAVGVVALIAGAITLLGGAMMIPLRLARPSRSDSPVA